MKLFDVLIKDVISEGVYDPNIFKAIILAGGPGSGKSYVAGKTMQGHGLKVVNSDQQFEYLLDKLKMSKNMASADMSKYDPVRARAKDMTSKKMTNYIDGRLGMIIDGTGADYEKIKRIYIMLKNIGYDVYMVFVNTSLEVAHERNQKRTRTLPKDIVDQSWRAVQNNIGKFQNLFGGGNMIIVDNNNASDNVLSKIWKKIRGLLKKPITNIIAKKWISNQLVQKSKR